MKSNLLLKKIQQIQIEYKELLTKLLPRLTIDHAPEAVDEISIFWYRHRETVQMYMKNWLAESDSYIFTAATFMDYEDNEHYPFLLMGNQHILDDPLCRYSEVHSKMPQGKEAAFLYEQIEMTAKDNIALLNNIGDDIIILPIRLLNDKKYSESIIKIGEQAFMSLFEGLNSIKDYFEKCDSIEDIIDYARKDIGRLVLFSEEDDISLSFEERFRNAIIQNQDMINTNRGDAENFFMLVYGYMQQAMDILVSCIEYRCIPFIRYPVALHYVSLLSGEMLNINHIASLRFKMSLAFVVYRLCNKEKLAIVNTNDFISRNKEYNFYGKLMKSLSEQGITETNFLNHSISQLVLTELDKFYESLTK